MRLPLLGLLVVVAACAAEPEAPAVPASPASAPPAPTEAAADEPIEAFFARFQAAVRDHDLDALTAMARFPLGGAEADREAFVSDLYPAYLQEGDFRDVLLAATPDDLEPTDDGGYTYQALVNYNEDGEVVEHGDYESAVIFVFEPDGAGSWQLTEVWFAG